MLRPGDLTVVLQLARDVYSCYVFKADTPHYLFEGERRCTGFVVSSHVSDSGTSIHTVLCDFGLVTCVGVSDKPL